MLAHKPPAGPVSVSFLSPSHHREFSILLPGTRPSSPRFTPLRVPAVYRKTRPLPSPFPPRAKTGSRPGPAHSGSAVNMAQVDTCLRRVFIAFNILFAIIGGLIIGFALILQIFISTQVDYAVAHIGGIIAIYILGALIMVIAILGAYGAHKENKVSLIIFLVCMVIGSLLMLRSGVRVAFLRPEQRALMESEYQKYLPLDTASEELKEMANTLQETLHCCGLFSYKDWENNIPDSCLCDEEAKEQGACNVVMYKQIFMEEQTFIYSKPCVPILIQSVELFFDISICVDFVLLLLALLGMVLSSIIIHQMRHPDRPTVLTTVPTIFTAMPPKYQELHNPPNC